MQSWLLLRPQIRRFQVPQHGLGLNKVASVPHFRSCLAFIIMDAVIVLVNATGLLLNSEISNLILCLVRLVVWFHFRRWEDLDRRWPVGARRVVDEVEVFFAHCTMPCVLLPRVGFAIEVFVDVFIVQVFHWWQILKRPGIIYIQRHLLKVIHFHVLPSILPAQAPVVIITQV